MDREFATSAEKYTYEIEAIGDNLLNSLNRVDGSNMYICRMYINGKLLIMDTGKYQWNSVAAAKNALHNQIEDMLKADYPNGWWKIKQDVFDTMITKIEIRKTYA